MTCINNISIESCLTVEFPEVQFRKDTLLASPSPIFPADGQSICLDVTNVNDTQICLTWKASPSVVSHYLLQLALNAEFTGASVREVTIPFTQTSYCLLAPFDIRYGSTYYWRVIALDTASCGVSWKSETRSFTYSCGNDTNYPDKADRYNVNAEMHGPDFIGCCSSATFWASLTWDCNCNTTAPDGSTSTIVILDDIVWDTDNNLYNIFTPESDNPALRIIKSCTQESQEINITATAVFREVITDSMGAVIDESTFEKQFEKKLFLDCELNFGIDLASIYEDLQPCGTMSVDGCPMGSSQKSEVVTVFGPVFSVSNYGDNQCPLGSTKFEKPAESSCECNCLPNEIILKVFEGNSPTPIPETGVITIPLVLRETENRCGECQQNDCCCKDCKKENLLPINISFTWAGQNHNITFTDDDAIDPSTPASIYTGLKILRDNVNFYEEVDCNDEIYVLAVVIDISKTDDVCEYDLDIAEACYDSATGLFSSLLLANFESVPLTTPCNTPIEQTAELEDYEDTVEITATTTFCGQSQGSIYHYVAGTDCVNFTLDGVTYGQQADNTVLEIDSETCMITLNLCQISADCIFNSLFNCECNEENCSAVGPKQFTAQVQLTSVLTDPITLDVVFNSFCVFNQVFYDSELFSYRVPADVSGTGGNCIVPMSIRVNPNGEFKLLINSESIDFDMDTISCGELSGQAIADVTCQETDFQLIIDLSASMLPECMDCGKFTQTQALMCDPFSFSYHDSGTNLNFVIDPASNCEQCPGVGLESRVNIPLDCGLHQGANGLATDIVLVQLTETLLIEGTAEAFPVKFSNGCWQPKDPPGPGEEQETITVEDLLCLTMACKGDIIPVYKQKCGNWIPVTERGIRGLCVAAAEDIEFGKFGVVSVQLQCSETFPLEDCSNSDDCCSFEMQNLTGKFYNDCLMEPISDDPITMQPRVGVPMGTSLNVYVSRFMPETCDLGADETQPKCCLKCCEAVVQEVIMCQCPQTIYVQGGCQRVVLNMETPETCLENCVEDECDCDCDPGDQPCIDACEACTQMCQENCENAMGYPTQTFVYECCDNVCNEVLTGSPARVEVDISCDVISEGSQLEFTVNYKLFCGSGGIGEQEPVVEGTVPIIVDCPVTSDGCYLGSAVISFEDPEAGAPDPNIVPVMCSFPIIISNCELPCDPCSAFSIDQLSITGCDETSSSCGVDFERSDLCCNTKQLMFTYEVPQPPDPEGDDCIDCCSGTDLYRGLILKLQCIPTVDDLDIVGTINIIAEAYCSNDESMLFIPANLQESHLTTDVATITCDNTVLVGCHTVEVCGPIELCFTNPEVDDCQLYRITANPVMHDCGFSVMGVRQVNFVTESDGCNSRDCGEPVEILLPAYEGNEAIDCLGINIGNKIWAQPLIEFGGALVVKGCIYEGSFEVLSKVICNPSGLADTTQFFFSELTFKEGRLCSYKPDSRVYSCFCDQCCYTTETILVNTCMEDDVIGGDCDYCIEAFTFNPADGDFSLRMHYCANGVFNQPVDPALMPICIEFITPDCAGDPRITAATVHPPAPNSVISGSRFCAYINGGAETGSGDSGLIFVEGTTDFIPAVSQGCLCEYDFYVCITLGNPNPPPCDMIPENVAFRAISVECPSSA